jgi:hypothetical protein
MIIFVEKKTDANLKQIRFFYARLHLLFDTVAQAFTRWSLKREGAIFEAEGSSAKEARAALLEIDRVLSQLSAANKKLKFDDPALEKRYREELAACQKAIEGMASALNTIWKRGKPSPREVPFGDTTNYEFIIGRLVFLMNRANKETKSINSKTEIFNKVNKALPPLPALKMMSAPSWARNL